MSWRSWISRWNINQYQLAETVPFISFKFSFAATVSQIDYKWTFDIIICQLWRITTIIGWSMVIRTIFFEQQSVKDELWHRKELMFRVTAFVRHTSGYFARIADVRQSPSMRCFFPYGHSRKFWCRSKTCSASRRRSTVSAHLSLSISVCARCFTSEPNRTAIEVNGTIKNWCSTEFICLSFMYTPIA